MYTLLIAPHGVIDLQDVSGLLACGDYLREEAPHGTHQDRRAAAVCEQMHTL
jgi:hypothetical protein